MRKLFTVSALLFVAVGVLFGQDKAAVTVRNTRTEAIPESELNQNIAILEQQANIALTQEQKKEVLEQMVNAILLVQEAEADRTITTNDEEVSQAAMGLLSQQLQLAGELPPGAMINDKSAYLQIAGQAGINVAEFEDTVRKQILVEKLVAARESTALQAIPRPTSEEIAAAYQERLQEFLMKDSVWFKQIFFRTQGLSSEEARAKGEEARDVYRRLMNTSATFEELVASESEDEQSRAAGGETGPLSKGDPLVTQIFGQAFVDKVFAMGIGETSEPLQTPVGYHIVRISKKEPAQLLPATNPEVRQYLEQVVYAAKFQAAFDEARNRIAADIRETATVRYIGEYANW